MLRQTRHFSDPSRQCCVFEFIDHSAEPLFTGHLRLRRADQKARSRRPDVARALQAEVRKRRAEGATLKELAESYNVGIATISRLSREAA
jgi:hypothetical protein